MVAPLWPLFWQRYAFPSGGLGWIRFGVIPLQYSVFACHVVTAGAGVGMGGWPGVLLGGCGHPPLMLVVSVQVLVMPAVVVVVVVCVSRLVLLDVEPTDPVKPTLMPPPPAPPPVPGIVPVKSGVQAKPWELELCCDWAELSWYWDWIATPPDWIVEYWYVAAFPGGSYAMKTGCTFPCMVPSGCTTIGITMEAGVPI